MIVICTIIYLYYDNDEIKQYYYYVVKKAIFISYIVFYHQSLKNSPAQSSIGLFFGSLEDSVGL